MLGRDATATRRSPLPISLAVCPVLRLKRGVMPHSTIEVQQDAGRDGRRITRGGRVHATVRDHHRI